MLDGGGINKIFLFIERRKKNRLGLLLGLEIHENCFEEGLQIYHRNIVVNSQCHCGKNIKFHGMNCIGNKGTSLECPKVEDNVEFGFGSCAFGSIVIPENCIVAANSTVLNSFEKGTLIIAGSPAIMKYKENEI